MGTVNLDRVKETFEKALAYSQAYPFDLDSTELIKKWYAEKKSFIKKFGGTIWKSREPIEIVFPEEEREKRFNEFIETMEEADLSQCANKEITFESFLIDNYEGFFDNRVVKDYPELNLKRGTKLLKSFKLFLPDDCIKFAQNIASQYLQEGKIKGYLYLSVDPLDFLTISENNSNWNSCQALYGSYRSGNLSYMVDDTTIIAYIASEKQEQLRCFPEGLLWNDKKWRMLIHVGRNSLIYNKPYPFPHRTLLEEVNDTVKAVLYKGKEFFDLSRIGFKWINAGDKTYGPEFIQLTMGGRVYDSREIFDCSEYIGYLDLTCSSTYNPIASIDLALYDRYHMLGIDFSHDGSRGDKEGKLFKNILGVKVGKKYPCPCCGKGFPERTDSFLCKDCITKNGAVMDFFDICSDCGRRIYEDEELFIVNKEVYCKKCYKSCCEE